MPPANPERDETRPDLTPDLASTEFLAWSWLKEELVDFCSTNGLRTAGTKPNLASRIEAFLAGSPIPKRPAPSLPAGERPTTR